MRETSSPQSLCACHSGIAYEKCCRPWHQGKIPARAEQLMRSRYSAYAYGMADYILDTTHPDHPDQKGDRTEWRRQILRFSRSNFHGLKILSHEERGEEAYVIFFAEISQHGHDASFCERSLFHKKGGKWLYLFGEKVLMRE